jgi:hypothetical protein
MPSPDRLLRYAIRYALLVGLPLLIILSMAALTEWGNLTSGLQVNRVRALQAFVANVFLNAFPGFLVMIAIPIAASWYVDKVYSLGGFWKGYSYLDLIVLGPTGSRPFLVVREGRIAGDAKSPLAKVGGPGLLVIYNSNAVVTEQYGSLKRVLGPGYSRLEQFERIYDIIDLRPQHWVYTVSALTRDGIPVSCDVDITFKIDDHGEDGVPVEPSEKTPYPFTEEAVLKAALSTRVREEDREDQVMKWTGRLVIGDAEGALRGILARYRLDELIYADQKQSSGENVARNEIRKDLREALDQSAANIGVRIISLDIGNIDVKVDLPVGEEEAAEELADEVVNQWIGAWQAELERTALMEQAEGEASLASLEAVSVQAQAEMVLTLTEAMQSLIRAEDASAYRRALRLIETLRWMTFDPNVRAFIPLEPLRFLKRLEEIVEKDRPAPISEQRSFRGNRNSQG